MTRLFNQKAPEATEALYSLACGPHICVRKYQGCIINGVRFHTRDRDDRRRSQNSGLTVEGNNGDDVIDYYGTLNEIIELEYIRDKWVVLFKGIWFDVGNKRSSIQTDGKIISINVTKTWFHNDPFVLASQAKQVFYLSDTKLGKNWRVVQKFQHRHIFDVSEVQDESMDFNDTLITHDQVYQDNELSENDSMVEHLDVGTLVRGDVDPDIIEANVVHTIDGAHEEVDDFGTDDELEDETLAQYCDDADITNDDHESDIDADA